MPMKMASGLTNNAFMDVVNYDTVFGENMYCFLLRDNPFDMDHPEQSARPKSSVD